MTDLLFDQATQIVALQVDRMQLPYIAFAILLLFIILSIIQAGGSSRR